MASKKRILRRFSIREISGVDSPAQIHARVAIIKRADDDELGKAERPMSDEEIAAFDAHGSGPAHDGLLAAYQDRLRGHPHLSPEQVFAETWRRLPYGQSAAIRDEESGAYAARQAEEAALRAAALNGSLDKRAAAILKGSIASSTIQALAELRREADPRLTIEKARAEVREIHIELARREREARLESLSA
jgi:hypothetical protein